MQQAKQRNPNIKLYGLPWAFPAWVGNGTGNPYAFPNLTASYIVKWVEGAKTVYDLDIDYVVCMTGCCHDHVVMSRAGDLERALLQHYVHRVASCGARCGRLQQHADSGSRLGLGHCTGHPQLVISRAGRGCHWFIEFHRYIIHVLRSLLQVRIIPGPFQHRKLCRLESHYGPRRTCRRTMIFAVPAAGLAL